MSVSTVSSPVSVPTLSTIDGNRFPLVLTGDLKRDDVLEVVPKHLFRIKRFQHSSTTTDEEDHDLVLIKLGWKYMKHLSPTFALTSEPNDDDYSSALKFIRNLMNHGVKLYLQECSHAIVKYVKENWVRPPGHPAELVQSFDDVKKLLRLTLTLDEKSEYFVNWQHVHFIYTELFDESISNDHSARLFCYRYLNEAFGVKTFQSRRRSDGGPSDMNSELWFSIKQATKDWVKPVKSGEPLQCGFVSRLNRRRRGIFDQPLIDKIEKKCNIIFRIQGQRHRNLECLYSYQAGKNISWQLFQAKKQGVKRSMPGEDDTGDTNSEDLGGSSNTGNESRCDDRTRVKNCVDFFKTEFHGELSSAAVMDFLGQLQLETGIKLDNIIPTTVQGSSLRESAGVSSLSSPILLSPVQDGRDSDTTTSTVTGWHPSSSVGPITEEQEGVVLTFPADSDDDGDDLSLDPDEIVPAPDPSPEPPAPVATVPAPAPTERSSPRKSAGKTQIEDEVAFKYDKKSYKLVRVVTKKTCSACACSDSGQFFECLGCECQHIICMDCMEHGNKGKDYGLCEHQDSACYEKQVRLQPWMSEDPSKQCSKCGEHSNISKATPMMYCKICHLHRLCTGCWHELLDSEKRRVGRRTRQRCCKH